MQPFDEITSPELGLEDDVLDPAATCTMASPQPPPDLNAYPTPKWMRSPPSHTLSSLYHTWLRDVLQHHTPALLRPRLSARYILFTLLALYISHRLLTSSPLFTSPLPPYTGPYGVGAIDIEHPLDAATPRRRINNVTFHDGTPAFEVETVLFTLYYPTAHKHARNNNKNKKLRWIPEPVSATATGYARALGIANIPLLRPLLTLALRLATAGVRIPAELGAPLIPPSDTDIDSLLLLPVMVFSHGMLSSRTDYTTYLGELASRGVVVAALEHRDGSSPASRVSSGSTDKWRYYFGLDDLDLADRPGFDTAALKDAQLAFRAAEIEAALAVLSSLNRGDGSVHAHPLLAASFAHRLDTARPTLGGHSYGGTGALRALSAPSAFSGAVVLDPGKSSGPLNAAVAVPLVICHSSSWSRPGPSLFFGRPHFEVVREIAERVNANSNNGADNKGWFLTSVGTAHPSITDAAVLVPRLLALATGSSVDGGEGIRQYVHLTRDFVRFQHTGRREGLLALSAGAASRDYDPKHNDNMPEPWRQYWQMHVAPD